MFHTKKGCKVVKIQVYGKSNFELFCTKHKVRVCGDCFTGTGEHEIKSEYNPKDRCCVCNDKIDIRNYNTRGNFCITCIERIDHVVDKKITREEADKMMQERINQVKEQNNA